MVDSARPTTRRRVSIESESELSPPGAELRPPPPSTSRTDVSMSCKEATTRKARQVSFDAIAPEEANTTEADTINLVPGPPSQTNQKIEDTKKLDFT